MRKLQATIRLCQIKFSYCYVGLSHEFSMMNKSPDDFETEHEWLTHCAEHGFTESMLKLSMQILTSRTDEKRVAEAYKWLFLARFLNDSKSEDPLLLLRSCLSDSQIQEGEALVDVWATQKQSEFNEDTVGYTPNAKVFRFPS